MTALVPVVVVLAVIATMVVIKATGGSAAPSSSHLSVGRDELVRPDRSHDAVVRGRRPPRGSCRDARRRRAARVATACPRVVSGSSILKDQDGKPIVTYVGAEYCPYCAAERWALAVALSRFGTFTNLSATHSASNDVYPNTQTLSFYGSSYSSPYLDFQPVEEATNQVVNGSYQTLQTPTAAQSALLAKYDSAGSIPFLDVANKYVVTGCQLLAPGVAGPHPRPDRGAAE